MPYFIRAKTYYRYAEQQLRAAEDALDQGDLAGACQKAKEAVEKAMRALWSIVEFEAPEQKPSVEEILSQIESAVEPTMARELRRAWRKIEDLSSKGLDQDKVKEVIGKARFAVRNTREILEPLVGPPESPKKRPFLL